VGIVWKPFLASFCISLALAAAASAQQAPGPYKDRKGGAQTKAEQRAVEVLELVNSGDADKVKAYATETFGEALLSLASPDEHVRVFQEMLDTSRGFELYGFRAYDPPRSDTDAVAILKNRLTEGWDAISVSIEAEPPHRIASLRFSPARPPSDLPPAAKLTQAELVSELRAYLERLAKQDAFSGAVLLARNGEVLFKSSYGEACKSFHIPNKTDTKFNLGSMNKMFTAVAIAQLAERGKLSIDDPVSKHLSADWLPREAGDKIKIEHLLTHTSGLGSHFTDELMNASRERFREVNDYQPIVSAQAPSFEPGTDWAYSNAGFLVLGAIIESVTGQRYFDYVRENVAKPAGMVNTDCYDMDRPIENLAIGYVKEAATDGQPQWRSNIFMHVAKGGPAGGGYSTVEDLLRFDQALRGGKLVSAETRERMWSPKPGSPDYGYGFSLSGQPGNRIVGHGGGFPGINSDLSIHVDSGYTVAIMSNYDRGAGLVGDKISELLGRLE
jgi:CubicO group peptidase (beta-lactamase class C family)